MMGITNGGVCLVMPTTRGKAVSGDEGERDWVELMKHDGGGGCFFVAQSSPGGRGRRRRMRVAMTTTRIAITYMSHSGPSSFSRLTSRTDNHWN